MSAKRKCTCVEAFDRTSDGVKLDALICLSGGPHRALIATVKVKGSRKKAPLVVANYCPFCGIKYGTNKSGPIRSTP